MKKLIAVLAVLFICAGAACAETGGLAGSPMPDFTFVDTDGAAFRLSERLEAKDAVVLNFFSTRCPICREVLAAIENACRGLSDRLEIVAVSDDPDDLPGVIDGYKSELGLSFPMGYGAGILETVPVAGCHVTLVIDGSGNIGYAHTGAFANESQLRAIVGHCLDGSPAAGCFAFVCDQNGDPVPGVTVKFCDTACRRYTSDARGLIAVAGGPARYLLEIQEVPEGCSYDPAFEAVCDSFGECVLIEVERQ